jgi:hypothetical protein
MLPWEKEIAAAFKIDLMSTLKKVFIFSSLGLALLLFFGGIYFLLFKPAPENPSPATTADAKSSSQKDVSSTEKMSALTDEAVLAPTLNGDSSAIKYYSPKDQGFYEISFDGKIRTLILQKELLGLADIIWSPDKNQAIFKIKPTPATWNFVLFNFSSQKETVLGDNIDNIFWQNNTKIIYQYFDPNKKERTLNISDTDGSNWKKVADLNFTPVFSAGIPQSGLISFWNNPDAYTESILRSASLISGENKIIFQGKFGADFLWGPDGSHLLASHSVERAGKKIQLAITNNNGGEYKNLEIPTLTVKCTWSKDNKTVYYALPASIPENSILPNDYFSNKFQTADTFWKVNVLTGEKNRLIDLEKISAKIDSTNLFLSPDESLLFFTNRIDGKLYQINL